MRIHFSIPGAAAEAIQIDAMGEMLRGSTKTAPAEIDTPLEVSSRRAGKGYSYQVSCSVAAAKYILSDCDDRAEPRRGFEGFDQPSTWQQGCKVAAVRIRRALKAAGVA